MLNVSEFRFARTGNSASTNIFAMRIHFIQPGFRKSNLADEIFETLASSNLEDQNSTGVEFGSFRRVRYISKDTRLSPLPITKFSCTAYLERKLENISLRSRQVQKIKNENHVEIVESNRNTCWNPTIKCSNVTCEAFDPISTRRHV